MPELTAGVALKFVRDYFDAIKKSKFIFDPICVKYNSKEEVWAVSCAIANVFDEIPRRYTVCVDDKTGDIIDVCECE